MNVKGIGFYSHTPMAEKPLVSGAKVHENHLDRWERDSTGMGVTSLDGESVGHRSAA